MTPEDRIRETQRRALRDEELEALQPITFEELETSIDQWMLLPDRHFIKFLVSYYCAHMLSQRAIFAGVIAPSGGGKTEILNALLELPKIRSVSMITPNTFLSGTLGKDNSLLPRIEGSIMLFKDWTTILGMQRDARQEIFSQFREIWDGSMTKEYGNGQTRTWKGKVSVLFACTEAVDITNPQYSHLGERFIYYRPIMPDRKEVALRALNNSAKQEEMTNAMQNAFFAFFKGIDFENIQELPPLGPELSHDLVLLANFGTKARSGVIRDFGMKKEVLFVPTPEMPTRVLQQLSLLAQGAMIANKGVLLETDIQMLYKVMLDSIPRTNKMVIMEMAKADGQTTAEIATALDYPTETIRTYLENQAMLGICKRVKLEGRSDRWTMLEEYRDLIRKYEHVEELTDTERKIREANAANKTVEEYEQFSDAEEKANEAFDGM